MKNQRGSLSELLGLRPLDRVQINSAAEIREMTIGRRMGHPADAELPFLFFQRVVDDSLEVCSPGGYVAKVAPEDVCNLIRGEQIVVRATPRAKYLARLALPLGDRQGSIGDEWYEDAFVLAVEKDKWGRTDRVWVHFVDPQFNGKSRACAPIDDASRRRLETLCRRTRMPVINTSSSRCSADAGVARLEDEARQLVRRFFRASLTGHSAGVELLTMAGARPVQKATLNRLGVPQAALW